MNKRTYILPLFVAASASAQDVPPPPKPADGPTLEVTMKYIQDRLNGEGKVSSQVTYLHTSEEKADGQADTPGLLASHNTVNAIAGAASCALSFTLLSENESTGHSEGNYRISFRDVDKLLVESEKETVRRTSVGLDPDRFRYSPTMFLVTLVLTSGKTVPNHQRATDPKGVTTEKDHPPQKEAYVYFREEDTAQRVAKAMVHAAELCGGGNKDPF